MIKTRINATFLLGGFILLLYSGILITNNYRAQIELRKATIKQMKQDLEKQALTMGYFFSERKSDLKNLSEKRLLAAYFENLALGMSLEYGLRFSLNSITQYFRTEVEEKEVGNKKVFSRIALVDADGNLLADSDPEGSMQKAGWKTLLVSSSEPVFLEGDDQHSPQIIISQPYFFKNRYAGQIFAWINSTIPATYFFSSEEHADDRITALLFGQRHMQFSTHTPAWAAAFFRENAANIKTGAFEQQTIVDGNGDKHEVLVSRTAVQGTPFFLINILRASSLLGARSPIHLLVAMALLTAVVLLATGMLWRMNANNLALAAGLREADKRRAEIEEKNDRLKKEIAERREAEEKNMQLAEQLLHAQKMEAVGTLAGGIAHDFNNILTAVLGFVELAKFHINDAEQLASDLAGIAKGGQRAKELIRQILAFSRKGDHRKEVLSPAPLIKESLKLLRASVPSTIEILEHIDNDCGPVLAEPTMIQQIIMNLCTNAVQAMEDERGTLTVRLTGKQLSTLDATGEWNVAPGQFIELRVDDTGKGMDKTVLDRIFEPYFTTKDVGKGTGMGLSLVHGIVQNCGGLIRVESEVGRGSTFQIYLPVTTKAQDELRPLKKTEILPGRGEHILCIDDEPAILHVQQGLLNHFGYRVTTATSAVEALQLFSENPHRFDLVITDQTMPHLTGLEFARRALNIRPDTPIILCSGYSSIASEKKTREVGIRAYVMKPLDKTALAGLVRSVLDNGTAEISVS